MCKISSCSDSAEVINGLGADKGNVLTLFVLNLNGILKYRPRVVSSDSWSPSDSLRNQRTKSKANSSVWSLAHFSEWPHLGYHVLEFLIVTRICPILRRTPKLGNLISRIPQRFIRRITIDCPLIWMALLFDNRSGWNRQFTYLFTSSQVFNLSSMTHKRLRTSLSRTRELKFICYDSI